MKTFDVAPPALFFEGLIYPALTRIIHGELCSNDVV